MKRIILGLVMLLILTQNGFAQQSQQTINKGDAIYDMLIAASKGLSKQKLKCDKIANYHMRTGSPKECIKAVEMIKKTADKQGLVDYLYNTAQLYFFSEHNKIKAYEYWYEAAKLGDKEASENLSLLCQQDPWVCK